MNIFNNRICKIFTLFVIVLGVGLATTNQVYAEGADGGETPDRAEQLRTQIATDKGELETLMTTAAAAKGKRDAQETRRDTARNLNVADSVISAEEQQLQQDINAQRIADQAVIAKNREIQAKEDALGRVEREKAAATAAQTAKDNRTAGTADNTAAEQECKKLTKDMTSAEQAAVGAQNRANTAAAEEVERIEALITTQRGIIRTGDTAARETAQATLEAEQANLQAAQNRASDASQEVNRNTLMQMIQLCLQYYGGSNPYNVKENHGDGLIKSAEKKTNTIEGEKEQGCDIKALRESANTNYIKFLKKKYVNELCKISKTGHPYVLRCEEKPGDIKKRTVAQVEQEEAAAALRTNITSIATCERKINANYKFDTTNFFNYKKKQAKQGTLKNFISKLADWLMVLVSSVAVGALTIGGGLMVISKGNEERLTQGKDIVTYTVIGIIISMLALGIVNLVQSLFYF